MPDQFLDDVAVRRDAIGQGIVHEREEATVALVLGGVAGAGWSDFWNTISDFANVIVGNSINPQMSPGLAMVGWLCAINGLLLVFTLGWAGCCL